MLELERVIDVRSDAYRNPNNVVVISCTYMCYFAVQIYYLLLALAGRTALLCRTGGREVRGLHVAILLYVFIACCMCA